MLPPFWVLFPDWLFYFLVSKKNPGNLPLAFGQITLSIGIWVSFAVVSKLLVHWPFLFRTGSFIALVFVPLPFLYVLYYTQQRTWKWLDLLHFFPALVFLVDFWPIFTLSNHQKLALIIRDINDQNFFAQLRESRFFAPGFHQTFRTILVNVYWLAQCFMLYRWVKKQTNLSYEDKIWKNWMIVYLFFQAGLWLPYYLTFIWIDKALTYNMVYTTGAIWLVLSSILLLLYPSILHGHPHVKDLNTNGKPKQVPELNGRTQEADEQKLDDVKKAIDKGLEKNELFLKPGYTIHEFAKDIGIPVYQISKYITQYAGMGFIDFINQKRIEYCVQKLDAGDWKNITVEAIAGECGFNNRNSFTNAFKKFKGVSPSEYKAGQHSLPAAG